MFLPPQMHLEGLERVKNLSFYPLKQNLKENPALHEPVHVYNYGIDNVTQAGVAILIFQLAVLFYIACVFTLPLFWSGSHSRIGHF